jgi:hypothetical protein
VVVQLAGLEHRVEGDDHRAALPRAVLREEELGVVLGVDGDAVAFFDAAGGQQGAEAVGEVVQLAEGDGGVEVPDRILLRRPARGRLEEVHHALFGRR